MKLTPPKERPLHGHPRQGLRLHQCVPSTIQHPSNPTQHRQIISLSPLNNSQLTNSRCPGFVDEHPGGEEVLLDVGGQDSTEAFEDVGHSDEAREILEGLLVGTLKRGVRVPISPPLSAHDKHLRDCNKTHKHTYRKRTNHTPRECQTSSHN